MNAEKPIIGFKIELVVEPDDKGFHAYCPALKGLHTSGDTKEEAMSNARDAAVAYLQSSMEHGDPIPVGIIVHKESDKNKNSLTKHATRHTEDVKVACVI